MNAISQITPAIITAPGLYQMDGDTYHADPCETPSLSAGMINNILTAPAKCYHESSRLNPDFEPKDDAGKFTIGTVSHIIHLEAHEFIKQVAVCDFDDWRKKEAKQFRSDAKAAGKVAILTHQLIEVQAARAVFMANDFTRAAFANGKPEQSLFWRHPIYGFWCRARPDFLADSLAHLCDYKATANADPAQFGRHAANMGYHRRAAFYLEGVKTIFGTTPEHYWFVNQETKAPFLTSVVELDYTALDAGQQENDHAAGIFAKCLKTGDWYGYRDRDHLTTDRAFRVGLPPYALQQIDERLRQDVRKWPAPRVAQPEYEGVE